MNKNKKLEQFNKGEIIIYKPEDGDGNFEVRFQKETVWLSIDQMATLFGRDKSVISRHIKNIFNDKELDKKSVIANFATTAADGKIYDVNYYNLDVVISVGYRVKSLQGVSFRTWATKVLKSYLLKGYVSEKRLLEIEEKFQKLQDAIVFLRKKSEAKLLEGQEKEILNLLADYSKTLTLLGQYDKNQLREVKGKKSEFILSYDHCKAVITEVKTRLIAKKEAGDIFGNEIEHKFESIIKNLY